MHKKKNQNVLNIGKLKTYVYVIQQTMFNIEVCSQYRDNCKI